MAEGFNAGSVFVEIGAQIAKFKKDMAEARGTLDEFAASAVQASQQLDRGGGGALTAFDQIQNQSRQAAIAFGDFSNKVTQATINLQRNTQNFNTQVNTVVNQTSTVVNQLGGGQQIDKLSLSFARAAGRIVSVQIALAALSSGPGGPNTLKELFQSLSNGIQVAAASFQLLNAKAGAWNISMFGAAGIAAGVTVIAAISRHLEDMIKLSEEVTTSQVKSQEAINAWTVAVKDANEKADAFRLTLGERLTAAFSASETAFSANQKKLRELPEQISKIREEISKVAGGAVSDSELAHLSDGITARQIARRTGENFSVPELQKLAEHLGVLINLQDRLGQQQKDIAAGAPFAKANLDVIKLNEALQKTRQELGDVKEIGKTSLSLGVAEPAEVATKNLEEARKLLNQILEDNQRIQAIAFSGAIPSDQIEAFLKQRLHSTTDIGNAAGGVKDALREKKAIDAVNDLANTFSSAVGDGLRDAILNAQKPMEALANIGKNLFANMVDQTIKRLETGLTDAFKAITGAAGEGIGLAITGLFGAAGAVLSHLGNKSQSTFGNVQSAITSSEQTRGIIAGPSTIALQSVQEDLARVMAPVVDRLDISVQLLRIIARNTRGGASGGDVGGSTPAVRVATDLA